MLEPDEYSRLLVIKSFADYAAPSSNRHNDAFATVAECDHPLLSQPLSQAPRYSMSSVSCATVAGRESESRPGLTPPSSDGSSAEVVASEDQMTGSASGAPQGSGDTIIHTVGPNDSLAGVALRYSVSIAALRRANKLWPSDPIHFRTELLIPRGDTLRTGRGLVYTPDAALRSTVEPLPHDLITPSFVAARNLILSVLPARMSLDSLSSRTSVSEDHELDDLRTARIHRTSASDAPFSEGGHELSAMPASHVQYSLSSQFPCSPTDNRDMDLGYVLPVAVGDSRLRTVSSSPNLSAEQLSRRQPFAALPVRTSQLEPQPAMELPVRRSCIQPLPLHSQSLFRSRR